MKLPYREGTWFLVPLKTGKFALGLITRTTSEGKVILGYFFGPAVSEKPEASRIHNCYAQSAIAIYRFGDLSLLKGDWPIIGTHEHWDRSQWPMPAFVRSDELSKKAYRVIYSDNDPNLVESETPIPFGSTHEGRDAVRGAGAVELVLTKLLETE